MTGTLATIVTSLRAAYTAPVEEYYRTTAPSDLALYVQPFDDGPEFSPQIGNVFYSDMTFHVILEIPWDDKQATAQELSTAYETLKTWVAANRDIAASYVMTRGESKWYRIDYPNVQLPSYCIIVPLLIEWPKAG